MEFKVPFDDVYKIHDIGANMIYVFCGIFNDISDIFSKEELNDFQKNNTVIHKSRHLIYKTDTISAIKTKMILTLKEVHEKTDLTEKNIYMFASKMKKMDIESIYRDVTHNEEFPFNNTNILKLASNIVSVKPDIQYQDNYSFEDVKNILNVDKNKKVLVHIPLGMDSALFDNDPLFIVNPFYNHSKVVQKQQVINRHNSKILLEYLPIKDNNLFICKETDKDINKNIVNNYFPMHSSETIPTSKFTAQDAFHNMYHSRKQELPYDIFGIESVDVSLINDNSDERKFIPLGEIFKNIHATENILFINYNPGTGKEDIMRLHSNTISRNGKIIPYMSKRDIDKVHVRMNNKPKSISAFVVIDDVEIYIDLYKEGLIQVRSEHKKAPMSVNAWNVILKKAINPFIEQINLFLGSSGFVINSFDSIEKERIQSLKFVLSIDVVDKISLIKKIPCITHIFDVYNDEVSNTQNIDMRFKDVKEFDSNDAQILLIQSAEDRDTQMKILMNNYHMNATEATDRINRYYEHETERNYNNITTQYGLLVSMRLVENKLFIEINDLDSVYYLYDIQIYIDGILRITQKKFNDSSAVMYNSKLCGKLFDKSEYRNSDDVYSSDDDSAVDDINFDNFNMGDNDSIVNNGDNESIPDLDHDLNLDNFNIDNDDMDIDGEGQDGLVKDGASLNEYFLKKLKLTEPNLFTYEAKDGYTSYSRLCDSNLDRQPVIISNDEKQRIDSEHPGSYSHALRHGSDKDPSKHNWFICPRYWCLKTNSSLTQEEVDSGVCGGIIPKKSKIIPKGSYVYEFDSGKDVHHGKAKIENGVMVKGDYIHNGPGFLKTKNPNGQCLPCCFKLWNSKSQQEKNAQCTNTNKRDDNVNIDNKYVSGHQITPIDKSRWGFIPVSVQKFLNTNQEESQSAKNPAHIMPNKKCLLRYGVEKSNNQSFIACVAEIYSYKQGGKISTPSILEMKKIIASSINLDSFIRLNNGSLVGIFKPKQVVKSIFEKYIAKYKDTKFLQSLDTFNDAHNDFIIDTISSFENFLNFILDENHHIDHTYLWDLIIDDNPLLMKKGLNLVIIEVLNDDVTDNISILCPINSHKVIYNSLRDTVILLKNGVYYEPIYQYEERNYVLQIQKSFNESTATKEFLKTLKTIEKYQTHFCTPKPSKESNVYTFKRNIRSNELIIKLKNIGYDTKYQISNYQAKCVGLYTCANSDIEENGVFIPCFPSQLSASLKIKYMDDGSLWKSFDKTIQQLQKIKQLSNGEINCAPSIIVQDDLLFVGLLTETNQFVQLSAPEIVVNNSKLPIIKKSNYNNIDKIITTTANEDSQRVSVIRNISLEQQFYLAFRTIGRLHLNDYDNRTYKAELIRLFHSNVLYKKKLTRCIEILHILLGKFVSFGKLSDDFISSYSDVIGCNHKSSEDYCIIKNGINVLIVPDYNLVSQYDNKVLYYGKLADELIRNRRTQVFLLDPSYFVTVPNTQYKVFENELLIVHSLLNDEYFKNIKPFINNSYVNNITYDISDPLFHNDMNPYTNHVQLDDGLDVNNDNLVHNTKNNEHNIAYINNTDDVSIAGETNIIDDVNIAGETNIIDDVLNEYDIDADACVSEIGKVTGNAIAKWRFGNHKLIAEEIHFHADNPFCGFNLMSHIMIRQKHELPSEHVRYLKEILCKGYTKYYSTYGINIIRILKTQGKIELMNRIIKNKQSIYEIIMSNDYYLSDLDIWILCEEINLPVILFTSGTMKGVNVDWLYLSTDENDFHSNLHFIRTPSNNVSNIPIPYKLITPSMKYDDLRGIMKDKLKLSLPTDQNRMNVVDRLKINIIHKPK